VETRNPSEGKGAATRLPTDRDDELGRLLGGARLGALVSKRDRRHERAIHF